MKEWPIFLVTCFRTTGGSVPLTMSLAIQEVLLKHFSCFILLVVLLALHIPVLIFFLRHLLDKYCRRQEKRSGDPNTGTVIKCSRDVMMIWTEVKDKYNMISLDVSTIGCRYPWVPEYQSLSRELYKVPLSVQYQSRCYQILKFPSLIIDSNFPEYAILWAHDLVIAVGKSKV